MNELINDKGVYKTAPATPGLLIIQGDQSDIVNIKNFIKHYHFRLIGFM